MAVRPVGYFERASANAIASSATKATRQTADDRGRRAAQLPALAELHDDPADRRAADQTADVGALGDPRDRERDRQVEQDHRPDAALHDADAAIAREHDVRAHEAEDRARRRRSRARRARGSSRRASRPPARRSRPGPARSAPSTGSRPRPMKNSASMLEPMWRMLACRKPLVIRRHHSPEETIGPQRPKCPSTDPCTGWAPAVVWLFMSTTVL